MGDKEHKAVSQGEDDRLCPGAGAGLVVIVFLFVTPFFALLHEFTTSVPPEVELVSGFLWSLIAQLLSPMVSFLSFLFLYRFLPNTGVQVRDVWLGALGASMAFECAKWVFVWYLNTFRSITWCTDPSAPSWLY